MTVDIRRGLGQSDETLIEWAAEHTLPVAILATKADKLSRGAGTNKTLEIKRAAGEEIEVIRFSAVDGTGMVSARDRLLGWLDQDLSA
jgi:GTP-binding protein